MLLPHFHRAVIVALIVSTIDGFSVVVVVIALVH